MAAICSSNFGNPGTKCDKGDIRGVPVGLILTTQTFNFASFTSWATEADWLTAIKTKTVFPLPYIYEFDDNSEDDVFQETGLGVKIFIRDGKYIYQFRMDASIQTNIELQKFSGAKMRAFIIDSNGYIWGYSDDDTTIQGFSISSLKFGKKGTPAGDSKGWTPVDITFGDTRQLNDYGKILQPSFVASDLTSLANVAVTVVGTPTATELIVNVAQGTGVYDSTGSENTIPIAGIPEADFTIIKASDGAAQTADNFTDNGDGTYTFYFTGLVTGSVNLVSASSQTNTFLIESTGAASFTI